MRVELIKCLGEVIAAGEDLLNQLPNQQPRLGEAIFSLKQFTSSLENEMVRRPPVLSNRFTGSSNRYSPYKTPPPKSRSGIGTNKI